MPRLRRDDRSILGREETLRSWLVKGRDPIIQEINGFDIGWGGVQRWTTARMADLGDGLHLDFACGVGTFLAQLGWRFPRADLVGLNIDFSGPHEPIRELLSRARVKSLLVQGDARRMPFPDRRFDSVSCFLGLQDIEIGFGEEGWTASPGPSTTRFRRARLAGSRREGYLEPGPAAGSCEKAFPPAQLPPEHCPGSRTSTCTSSPTAP